MANVAQIQRQLKIAKYTVFEQTETIKDLKEEITELKLELAILTQTKEELQDVIEAPTTKELKLKLDKMASIFGIELDRRKSLSKMEEIYSDIFNQKGIKL